MHPAALSPVELADLLDLAYRADQGQDVDAPSAETRQALADYLGCHEEARESAWTVWRQALREAGEDTGDAEYWLDVEFIEPCHEEQRV
ncbi:hypothetical protein [Deinococcus aquaedulcis]|uniref:hypothetical protein n=1 Tax=Deinococcus aquaedulcis TaxID=2840455 RepID=UPI001C83830D|nr:hypothetical protein [Deinococcus aquaedulcis]